MSTVLYSQKDAPGTLVSRSTTTAPKAPSTPAAQKPQTPIEAAKNSPGSWRHPRMDEITRRQNATIFSDKERDRLVFNASALVASFAALSASDLVFVKYMGIPLDKLLLTLEPYSSYSLLAFRLLLLLNILISLAPLIRRRYMKDDLSDIPLTPSQRSLLGLPPSSTPATPGSQYITPPRYARSSTPRSSSGTGQRQTSGSPLSDRGRESPIGMGVGPGSGSPFSPAASPYASPLLQKAVGANASRRLSYGHSPLGQSNISLLESSSSGLPGTPTPAAGKGASVGLNNKWLYEKGRGSPGSRSLFS